MGLVSVLKFGISRNEGTVVLTCTESEELGETFQNHGRFHTVAVNFSCLFLLAPTLCGSF